jgi:hypothetical protein
MPPVARTPPQGHVVPSTMPNTGLQTQKSKTQLSIEEIIRETPPADENPVCFEHDSNPAAILQLTKEVMEILKKQKTSGEPAKAKQSALAKLDDIVGHLEEHEINYERQIEATRATPVDNPLFYGTTIEMIKSMNERMKSMEKEMIEMRKEMTDMKSTITQNAESSKTWAQRVATAPAAPEQQASDRPRKQKFRPISPEKEDELKEKRHKTAVTLTMAKVSDVTKNSLRETPGKEVTKTFQKAINNVYDGKTEATPQVCGFNVLSGDTVRLQCLNEQSATTLKNSMDWSKTYAGIELRKRKYGVVVHGISKLDLDPRHANQDETLQLEEENKRTNLHIVEILPLRRRAKRDEAALHHSIIIFTECPHEADDCINQGIIVKGRHYDAERYTPQLNITQCFRCYGYGHRATQCTTKHLRCGKCGDTEHDTKSCNKETPECFHCHGSHPAWHTECRKRDEESQKLDQERSKTSRFYTL